MPVPRPFSLPVSLLVITFAVFGSPPARAQLLGPVRGLPAVQMPGAGLPSLSSIAPTPRFDDLLRSTEALTRQLQISALLRQEPQRVAVDPQGNPVRRGEFLAMDLTPAQLAALQAQGFIADASAPADASLGLNLVVLHDTRRRSEARAMRNLQQAAPHAAFTYQYLYLPAGTGDGLAGDALAADALPTKPSVTKPLRVGLIDGGVDPADPALAHAHIQAHGCSKVTVSRHGTAVAARLVDGDSDALYAADLWCGDAVGGATSNLVSALAWMAHEGVPVINISLVGPDNPVLARAVQAMNARGHVLVAAVGNDGPAAPPLFPASYPGVIGVSAVDKRDHALPESGSGSQVAFCALGLVGSRRNAMRGTSFAAPIVARRAAQWLDKPRMGAAAAVVQQLAREARDLGAPGRDPRYGYGLLSP
ncbi:MAG: S8 family serine peptidase [Pseudomonadota bacterium]|nr:S8 family serine peptidase [Pseudomonadota bacterium]